MYASLHAPCRQINVYVVICYAERWSVAHTKSAKKSIKKIAERRARNRSVKRSIKTYILRAHELIENGDAEAAKTAVYEATHSLDKSAKKGVIHRNNAARRKSRLIKKLNEAFPPNM
jgi:small subunit ribosomal protein S20